MLESIIPQFSVPGTFQKADRFGSGLINDTYLCEFSDRSLVRKYILQCINTSVFARPAQVMKNVEIVTKHIAQRLREEGNADPFAVTPALISTLDGRSFYCDDGGRYWRMFHFIESGVVFDMVVDAKHAFEVGRGLGKFQALVSDLPPETLFDTLPGFHHTQKYLDEYDSALQRDVKKRAAAIAADKEFVLKRRNLAPMLVSLITSGNVPVRVVHNDPKVNNVMVHAATREALCMLDLDTVKPGTVLFDFGDCVRSAANPAGEDAQDLASVAIDQTLFESIARGYIQEAGMFLTKNELAALPLSVKVITFELGVRFLADYLNGDVYFKVKHPDHNLHRARVQFKLLESIEASEGNMASFVSRLAASR